MSFFPSAAELAGMWSRGQSLLPPCNCEYGYLAVHTSRCSQRHAELMETPGPTIEEAPVPTKEEATTAVTVEAPKPAAEETEQTPLTVEAPPAEKTISSAKSEFDPLCGSGGESFSRAVLE